MGEIKFSKEQLNAIELRGTSLMVSAAAGSGKTAVLVERIIRKITEENVDVDKLLIVTFTNAAASGMKKKIKAAIREKLKVDKDNPNLKRQMLLVDKANISTVHSFCLDLIKKYPEFLPEEIPGSFSLINETEKSLMMNQILGEIFSDYYEKEDKEFAKLNECYGSTGNDAKLTELVLYIYNFLVSIPDYEKWVAKSLKMISGKGDFYSSDYAKSLERHIRKIFSSLSDKYLYVLSLFENYPEGAAYYDFFKGELKIFENALSKENLKDLLCYIQNIEFSRIPSSKKSSYTEIAKNIREVAKSSIKKIMESYSDEIIEINLNSAKDYDIIKKLFEIVLLFDKKFKEEKYQEGYLDFNDLEHLTIYLLNDNGKLRSEFIPVKESFEEILVDEYQDTNDVQEMIFSLLSKQDNLFTVGDIKQSIYRFRHANPDLFLKRARRYKYKKSGKVVNLNANYRCHPNIVDTVNLIFSFLMSEEISGINYKDEEKLIAKGDFEASDENKLSTDIKIALMDKEDEEDFRKEAKIIASSIEEIVEDKGFLIDSKKVGYKDIAILVRSFNEKTFELLKELSKFGIPVSYEDKTQFFDTVEIKSLISLLKIIDNPYDDIAYISALRNVFSYTDDELLSLRLLDKKKSFYELSHMAENDKDKEIASYIDKLREFAGKYTLAELITKIYEDTFYIEKQARFLNGHKRKENLERLLDIASEYEETEYKGLYSFISYIDRIVNEKTKIANPKSDEGSDAVKVMSIHSSKGLEFPVVIVQGMNKPFNRMDFISDVVLSSSLGIGYNSVNPDEYYKYPSVYRNVITEEEKTQLLLEETRILYVALTRAKNKLIMTGSVKKKTSEEWYVRYLNMGVFNKDVISYIDFKGINSYFDMVLPPVLKCRNESISSSYCGDEWINIDDKLKIFIYESVDFEKENENSYINFENRGISDERKVILDEFFEYSYINPMSGIPAKISVTEATKRMKNEDENFEGASVPQSIYVPDFREKTKISSRERGILIHYIFENIDLELLKNSDNKMKVILDFIADNDYLKDKLTHGDLKKVQGMFESYIGIKMLRAKYVEREREFLLRVSAKDIFRELDAQGDKSIIIQGIIDCYFVDTKGDVYLLDYKYSMHEDEKIKEDYYYQIKLYKEALSKSLNISKEKIKSFIWNVEKETLIDF